MIADAKSDLNTLVKEISKKNNKYAQIIVGIPLNIIRRCKEWSLINYLERETVTCKVNADNSFQSNVRPQNRE